MPFAVGFKIREIHAFIATEADGTEGVAAHSIGNTMVPLICADAARLEALRPYAESVAKLTGATITLAKFSVRTDLEEISP